MARGSIPPFYFYIRQLKINKTKKYILLNTFIASLCVVKALRHRRGGWDVRGDPKAAGGCWTTGHFVFRWRNFCKLRLRQEEELRLRQEEELRLLTSTSSGGGRLDGWGDAGHTAQVRLILEGCERVLIAPQDRVSVGPPSPRTLGIPKTGS